LGVIFDRFNVALRCLLSPREADIGTARIYEYALMRGLGSGWSIPVAGVIFVLSVMAMERNIRSSKEPVPIGTIKSTIEMDRGVVAPGNKKAQPNLISTGLVPFWNDKSKQQGQIN
jgi:hypothetical protein